MDQFNSKNYPIYANFLDKLAKDRSPPGQAAYGSIVHPLTTNAFALNDNKTSRHAAKRNR